MPPYDVTYLGRHEHCPDVISFRFERPDGYAFSAGQWFRLTLATAEGEETKTFSHDTAPSDPDIELTTRMSASTFKRALAALEPGAVVGVQGPGGHLAVPPQARKAAFLIGGVGITPVRSILRDAQATERRFDDAVLFYGSRDPSCVPFGDEFDDMGGIGVRSVRVYERDAGIGDESGFITAALVRRHLQADDRPYLVAGPPVMVEAMERVLDDLEVPIEQRLIERFGPVGPQSAARSST